MRHFDKTNRLRSKSPPRATRMQQKENSLGNAKSEIEVEKQSGGVDAKHLIQSNINDSETSGHKTVENDLIVDVNANSKNEE